MYECDCEAEIMLEFAPMPNTWVTRLHYLLRPNPQNGEFHTANEIFNVKVTLRIVRFDNTDGILNFIEAFKLIYLRVTDQLEISYTVTQSLEIFLHKVFKLGFVWLSCQYLIKTSNLG